MAWQTFARSHAESVAHAGCALRAAATARSTSSTLAFGASARVSPVTGDTICRALSPVDATHSPPTKFSSVRTVTAIGASLLRGDAQDVDDSSAGACSAAATAPHTRQRREPLV